MSRGWLGTLATLAALGAGCSEDLAPPRVYPAPTFVMEWGKKVNVPGRLFTPVGIAVGTDRRVYVGDSQLDLIRIYTDEGVYLDSLAVELTYSVLFVDDRPSIHILSNRFGDPYRRLDLAGNPVDTEGFNFLSSMARNIQGTLFVRGGWSDSLQSRTGVLRVIIPSSPELWTQVPSSSLSLLGLDRQGILTVVSEYAVSGKSYSVAEQFGPDGRFLSKHSLGGADVSVSALQVDRSGNLIVINDKGRVLEKYSPQGTLLVRWVETDADHEPLLWPSGLALDADDNLYVTDFVRPRVVKYAN